MTRPFIFFASAICFYRLAADFAYVYYIEPYWSYTGFIYEVTVSSFALSWCCVPVAAYAACLRRFDPLSIFTLILILGLYIPSASFYCWSNSGIFSFTLVSVCLIIIGGLGRLRIPNLSSVKLINAYDLRRFLFLINLGLIIALIFYTGTSRLNFDIQQVYDYRSDQKSGIPVVGLVLANWVGKVTLPALGVLYLYYRNWSFYFIALFFSVLLFGVINSKSGVAYFLLASGFYFFGRLVLSYSNTHAYLVLASAFFIMTMVLLALNLEINLPAAFLVRRALFTPAKLLNDYIVFFQDSDFLFWSNQFLEGVVDYPLDVRMGEAVAMASGRDSNASTGYMASAFAQGGGLVVLLYTIALALILKFATPRLNAQGDLLVSSISLAPLVHIALNVDFVTAFITHGFLLLILILYAVDFKAVR